MEKENIVFMTESNYRRIVAMRVSGEEINKSLEYPPNCSRLTQQNLIIRELEEKRRSWADS